MLNISYNKDAIKTLAANPERVASNVKDIERSY